MGALLSQMFCFPTSPGHSFLTPDFSFSSVCSLGACILAPWMFYTASSALPGCFCSSLACKLCWQDPGMLVALPLIKTALLPFSSSYGTGGCPSEAYLWCPPPSSQLLHHNFNVFLRKVCRWLPEWPQRRRTWLHLSFEASFQLGVVTRRHLQFLPPRVRSCHCKKTLLQVHTWLSQDIARIVFYETQFSCNIQDAST